MEESKSNKYGIIPFDGKNFNNWLFRLKVILEENEVIECIKEIELKDAKKTRKCKSIIIQSISDSHLELIKDAKSPKEIIDSLEKTFLKRGISNQILARKRLLSAKYKEGSELKDFLLKFDTLVRELKDAGGEPSKGEIECYLLMAMPSSYDGVVSAIETLNSENVTIEFIKRRLLDEEVKKKGLKEQTEDEENIEAFAGYKGQSNYKKPFPFECYNCGKKGHMKADCKFRSNKTKKVFTKTKKYGGAAEEQEEHEFSFVSSVELEQPSCANITNNANTITFIADSGATDHLINQEKYLKEVEILEKPIFINTAKNGEIMMATKRGILKVENFKLKEVLFVPNLRLNLLSLTRIENAGVGIEINNGRIMILKQDRVIKSGYKENNLYKIAFCIEKEHTVNPAYCIKNDEDLWHRRLGHASQEKINILKRRKLINLSKQENNIKLCEPCLQGRQIKKSYKSYEPYTTEVLQVVHTDVCGPMNMSTYDDKKYIITFIDDYSKFTCVYLMRTKSEALYYLKIYTEMAEARFNKKITTIRCDNGKEYQNKDCISYCKKKGIKLEFTIAYNPQQNGKSERYNRTLIEKARTILLESKLPKYLWGEAVYCANYIINRIPTLQEKIPAEIWYKTLPNYEKLKVFGSVAYAYIPKTKRQGKFSQKSMKLYMVGYCDNGYKLWDLINKKVVKARDVIFNETSKEILDKDKQNSINYPIEFSENIETVDMEKGDIQNIEQERSETENEIREEINARSERNRKPPNWFKDYVTYHTSLMSEGMINEPRTLKEALESKEEKYWKDAIKQEMKSHEKHGTWTRVKRPEGKKIIESKWVFKKKDDNVYKARLVAKGFQSDNYSDTYAPVGRLTTLRSLLVMANYEKYLIEQMDVKTAFLHGTLEEEIYMCLPEEECSEYVCKLNKSLYGLKQSPRCWNEAFHNYMVHIGLKCSQYDNCLYLCSEKTLFVFLFVDDIILISKCREDLLLLKSNLKQKFEMVELGEIKRFLGINIERDIKNQVIKLHQKDYISKVLNRFNMDNCKGVSTPCEIGLKLEKTEEYECTLPYRELIGCLIYLCICTRPDLCFTVNYFSRYQNNASNKHFAYLKRVLRYLKTTIDYGLVYKKREFGNICLGYCDSDWAGDHLDRKSISGFCVYLYGNIVSWSTLKQKTVSLSTAESEYIALSNLCCEILWFRGLLSDLKISCKSFVIFEDNQSCIHIAKNRENTKRVKHIDIKHHFIRNLIENNTIELKYIETHNQVADILTKALCKPTFCYFRNLLCVESC